MTISVFLVDDHEIVRRGIAELIAAERDMQVVGECDDVRHALSRIDVTHPTVALLDVRLPDGSGVDLCRDIRSAHPEIACIMLTAYDDDEAMASAVLAGAAGYVLKDVRGTNLLESIRSVAAGRSLLSPVLTKRLVERMGAGRMGADEAGAEGMGAGRMGAGQADDPRLDSLGRRERQILDLIAEGRTNREIGEQLGLAEKTVKNYVSGLLGKLGVQHRTQAAVLRLSQSDRER